MRSDARSRRRRTRLILASAVAVALGASGAYIATADAAETKVPSRLQAEAYNAQHGVKTEKTSDQDGGRNVGWLKNGDWMRYDNVQIGAAVSARLASGSKATGSVELRVGSPNGTLVASFPVARTGGWQKWVTRTAAVPAPPTGKQTLFESPSSTRPARSATTCPTTPSSSRRWPAR